MKCVCGHAFSSHRQDPNDLYVSERCKTCGCGGFENEDEAKMQGDEEHDDDGGWPQPGDMPNMAGGHEHWDDR